MAVKPLAQRIDDMAIAAAEETTETGTVLTDQQAIEPPMSVMPEEGVQVAGKLEALKGLGRVIQEVTKTEPPAVVDPLKRIEKPTPDAPEVLPGDIPADVKKELRKSAPVRVVGDKVIVQGASPETFSRIVEIMETAPVAGRPPEVRPNLDVFRSEDDAKKFAVAATEHWKDWVDTQRRAGRTIEDIIDEGARFLVVEGAGKALRMLVNRKPGDRPFSDYESAATMFARLDLANVVNKEIDLALESNDPDQMFKATQLMTLFGYINAAELGNAADYGRGMALRRMIPGPDEGRVRRMQQIVEQVRPARGPATPVPGQEGLVSSISTPVTSAMDQLAEMGGADNVKLALRAFRALPDQDARVSFASRLARATLDSVAEIYTSALVSNFVTHAFNILGTPIHASMMLAERYAAARFTGDKERAAAILAGFRAMPKYFNQAMAAGARAWKTEMASDMTTKFDQDRIAVTPQNFGVAPDTMLGKTIDIWGQGMRLLGFRVLTTTDETYKALLRGMEMEMQASYEAGKAFNFKLDEGGTVEDATNFARDAYQRAMASDATYDQAAEFAKIATFQDDLGKGSIDLMNNVLAQSQQMMTHPLMKIMGFPFFKTPMQIMMRIQERTPLATIMPSFWKAIVAPANETDRSVALAKLGMSSMIGTTFMGAAYMTGDEILWTGYGPTQPAERARWLEKHEPYSFGVKQPDGSYKWGSYSRYDPVSGIIAMWADIRDTTLKMDDPEAEENLLMDASLATVHYMTETHPMIDFVSEINYTMGPSFDPAADKFERIQELLQKQLTDVGMNVGQSMVTGGLYPQSLAANLQRYADPFAKSSLPEDQYAYLDGPGFRLSLRGAYESIQKARSRNPLFADATFTRHNEWFEPIQMGTGDLTTFLPLRIQHKRFNIINTELEALGGGLDKLQPSMGESMIKLNDQEMERYKELYNHPTRSAVALQVLAGIPQKEVDAMTPKQREAAIKDLEQDYPTRALFLTQLINSEMYQMTVNETGDDFRAMEKGEKLDAIKAYNSVYKSLSKDLMLREYPELKRLMDQRDEFKKKQGRLPRALPLSQKTTQMLGQ
jgi:hypothetical protein